MKRREFLKVASVITSASLLPAIAYSSSQGRNQSSHTKVSPPSLGVFGINKIGVDIVESIKACEKLSAHRCIVGGLNKEILNQSRADKKIFWGYEKLRLADEYPNLDENIMFHHDEIREAISGLDALIIVSGFHRDMPSTTAASEIVQIAKNQRLATLKLFVRDKSKASIIDALVTSLPSNATETLNAISMIKANSKMISSASECRAILKNSQSICRL